MARLVTAGRLAELTNRELGDLCGTVTVARGLAYAREGRVVDVDVSSDGAHATGWVGGSQGQTYLTQVALRPHEAPETRPVRRWHSECSCPVASDCKHAVAVAARVREIDPAPVDPGEPPRPTWERALGGVLLEDTPRDVTPVGLLLEPATTARGRARVTEDTGRGQLRLRPVVPGVRGQWIRTGVSWESFAGGYYGYGRVLYADEHVDALTAIADAHRRSVRTYGYGRMPDAIVLDHLGPGWVALLRAADRAGIRLLTDLSGDGAVAFAPEPAELVVDIERTEDGAALHPRLDLPVEPGTDTHLVGSPATGFWLRDGATLVLGALAEPLDATRQRLLDLGVVEVPEADWTRFTVTHLPGLRRKARVRSLSPELDLPEVVPPRLALRVTVEPGHRMHLAWGYRYGGADGVHVPLAADEPDPMRDHGAERRLVEQLRGVPEVAATESLWQTVAQHPRLVPEVRLHGFGTVAFAQLLPVLEGLAFLDVEVEGEVAEYSEVEEAPLITVSTSEGGGSDGGDTAGGSGASTDWFDLDISVTVAGEDVPLAPLIEAIARQHEHLILESGTWFSLERPELETLRRLVEEARALQDRPSDPLRISAVHVGLWEELAALGVVEEQSERWQRTVGRLVDGGDLEPAHVPSGLDATLRPYQVEGFRWLSLLWDCGLGGVLADDMGLGKTVQMLAMVLRAHERGELEHPVLVVAPTSVLSTWAGEAERFAPGLRTVVVDRTRGKDRRSLEAAVGDAQVVVTSYTVARIDEAAWRSRPWSAVVLDEAQFVKNHQAKTYQAVRRLSARAKFAITGTPLENSLMDLWSLLSIVAPGLHPRPGAFKEQWATPIERDGDADRLATLRRRVQPLMLRRTKEAVATELPPKQEQVLTVDLHPRHRAVYDRHLQRERQRLLGLIDDLDGNRMAVLRALTALRQLSLDPALVDEEYAGLAESAKVDTLVEHLGELAGEGHRALVFSQFTGFLAIVRRRLEAEGIAYEYLDGRTRDRAERIAAFRGGEAPVFLISLKAGGFGLTLTEADYVFVLDPWWNPAAEAQAIDRAHRIGQTQPVNVYRLVSRNTVEEKVVALQERKRDLFAKVVDEGAAMSRALTADDLRDLLSP
ncbi:DEAD/DEAH box helicase [Phycicoccus endophyticus]|uniref:DEAD/DEAH box helicase n=1 Tax=Phycicoccus endophyticus TaxID=1690220 RepID=A0A7G9R0I4_9MICO|nr:DEAD/DEAH box helicase [Phycicoccus endophyticus]NHI19386.1 DEAD/DEAH box helicase [Phycicoccus endophyticus]QNN49109.1 DEAD/DEAH box helicase [Phycicoccus endophyticus]GGL38676.1 DNA helicase [Phycicoccus endophyticus]